MEFPEVVVARSARWRLTDFLDDAGMELLEQELAVPGGRVLAKWFTPPEPCGAWRISHDQQRCLFQLYRMDEVVLRAVLIDDQPLYLPKRMVTPTISTGSSGFYVYDPSDCRDMVNCGLMRITDPVIPKGLTMPSEVAVTVLGVVWGAFFDANDDITVCDRFLMARGFLLSEDKFPEAFGSQEDFDDALAESVVARPTSVIHQAQKSYARSKQGIASMVDKFRRQVGP